MAAPLLAVELAIQFNQDRLARATSRSSLKPSTSSATLSRRPGIRPLLVIAVADHQRTDAVGVAEAIRP